MRPLIVAKVLTVPHLPSPTRGSFQKSFARNMFEVAGIDDEVARWAR